MSSKNMLDPIIRAMVGVPLQFLGVILDLCNKLAGKNKELWYEKLRTMLREQVGEVATKVAKYLRPLLGAEALGISACDGARTIAQAICVFRSHIDPDFKHWGLDVASAATPAARVQVHEQVKDATFGQMFTSLSSNLDKLVLMQAQVIEFCQKHASWLQQNDYSTLFLLKVAGEFFVAGVCVESDGLGVHVVRFDDNNLWGGGRRFRLVFPQLGAQ